jgi:KRAB domain-containing zinc finger protein
MHVISVLNYFCQSEHFVDILWTKSKMAAEQNTKNFKCEWCDYSTPKQGHLTNHINSTHKKIKKYWCDVCDYASYTRASLENHSNAVHLGIKDFKCDICDKAF